MRKLLRSGRGMGLGMAATLVTCLAGGLRGQNTAPVPVITSPLDEAMQAQAIANGTGLLAQPTWKAELPMNVTDMKVVGPTLVCSGGGLAFPNFRTTVLDIKTGLRKGEMNRIEAPMAWIGDELLSLGNIDWQLKLLSWSPSALAGAPQYEMTYETTSLDDRYRFLPIAIFADQRVIASESVPIRQQGPNNPASLTIRSFDRKTGRLQWATPVPGQMWSAEVRAAVGTVYVLVADGRGAIWEPTKGFVMGLNAADGKVLWKTEMGVVSSDAAVLGPVLVTLGENSEVTAYDGRTGEQRWRTLLSKDCDPAKSNIGVLSKRSRVYLDHGLVIAALTPTNKIELAGIALLDLQTGRQTGFFDAKGFPVEPGSLQVHGDTIIGGTHSYCVGINRKTLRLEWLIPAWSSTMADGVLYCANTPRVNGSATPPAEILALPLDAPRQPIPAKLP